MFTAIPLGVLLLVAAPTEPADDTAALVEVVRSLAAEQLHQTYRNLDTAVEFRFFAIRDAGELARMLRTGIDSAEEAERQLARVAKLKGLSKGDADEISRLRKVAKHLADQGNSLRNYWVTGVGDHWKDSEVARKAAWKELADILDLEGTKGIAPKPREPGKKTP